MPDIFSVEIKKENNILNIKLPSRLNAENAPEISKQISGYTDNSLEEIKFDAEALRYVSPDGLDIILDLKLKYKNVTVENARMGICDTLEAFGFTNFVEITKQYRFVSVKDCEMIGQGGHGAIYKTADDIIIKVYKDNSTLDIIEGERRFARNAFKNGVPTAIAFDVVQTEYGYGVMFEMLKGTTLGKYLAKHLDELEDYSVKFADLLKKLNTTEADKDLYGDFHDVYLGRIETAYKRGLIKEKDADKLKRIILTIPRGSGMIHGDYHPNNVMMDGNGELMLIDMADISRGNGFFDVGGSYLVMHSMPKNPIVRNYVKTITSMTPKACLKMWDIFMKRYYDTEDKELLKKISRQFRAFSNLRIMSDLGMPSSKPKILTKIIALYTKAVIIPKTDKYIELFKSTE